MIFCKTNLQEVVKNDLYEQNCTSTSITQQKRNNELHNQTQ